jgi:hypothetical protein
MLHQNCALASGGLCGSLSAFWSSVARNVDILFFRVGWAQCRFHKKRVRTRYAEPLFLYLVESAHHRVHSGVSGARNVDTIFQARVGPMQITQKEHRDTLRQTCVLHPVGSTVHILYSSAPGARDVDPVFFRLGGDWYGFHKNRLKTRHADLVFLHPVGSVGHVVHFGASGA